MTASTNAPDPKKSLPISKAGALQQLELILAHPLFRKSQQVSAFLRYAVETTLRGEADRLKEFVIGAEIFKRGDSFDPQTDNVVRVNANRLRSKLAEYYLGSGHLDPVMIELPRGGYVPVFRPLSLSQHTGVSAYQGRVRTTVGRDLELGQFRAAFATAVAGSGSMVTLSGDAGMGKTTLVEDFLSEIQPRTTWIACGRCSERLAKTDAFVPIFECLDELTRGESGEDAVRLMRTEAPVWLAQIASSGNSTAISARETGGVSHERMRREFAHFFEALSRIRPVIIFLDDVHWADASSCDLVAYLSSRMRGHRILVVATYRPSELMRASHPFLPIRIALERRGECRDIPLQFLTLDDAEHYLQLNFPGHNFPPEFAGLVQERTEGHPLFMTDLVHFFRDKRVVTEHDGHWIVNEDLDQIRKMIPGGSESIIRLQIEQYSEIDRRILQCAAVQGVQFDSAVVSMALSLDPGDVEDRLQALERVHRFVHSEGETVFSERTFSSRYRFIHVFYQNALFAELTPTRRAALSLAVAQALVALTGATTRAIAAEVALLFEFGRDRERASQYFLYAARNAASVFAYPEAVILCERGLRELQSLPESRERDSRELILSLTLGMAQMATCGYAAPEVENTYRRSRELCLRLNEKRRLVRVLWGLHTCQVNAGELVPALELSREMRHLADALASPAATVESPCFRHNACVYGKVG
jgi:predicted ATPase